MAVMNRLSPMIARPRGAATANRAAQSVSVATAPWQGPELFEGAEPTRWLEEIKLFATGWIGGLIFFGTYLG